MIKANKYIWRPDAFVCHAELNAELVRRTHNVTPEQAYIERDNLCKMVNKTKLIVNSTLLKLVNSR